MLIANEHKVNEAVAKGDKAAFLALVSPDAISADSGGFMPVKLFADALDQVKVTSWEIANPQVVWIDATSAVVAYTWTGAGTFQGQPFPPKAICFDRLDQEGRKVDGRLPSGDAGDSRQPRDAESGAGSGMRDHGMREGPPDSAYRIPRTASRPITRRGRPAASPSSRWPGR